MNWQLSDHSARISAERSANWWSGLCGSAWEAVLLRPADSEISQRRSTEFGRCAANRRETKWLLWNVKRRLFATQNPGASKGSFEQATIVKTEPPDASSLLRWWRTGHPGWIW